MDIEKYRHSYRTKTIPENYSGPANIRNNILVCLLYISLAILFVGKLDVQKVLIFLAVFLVFNFVEYCFHRWLSHNKKFARIYYRHVVEHHGFFDDESMNSDRINDLHVTILPTKTIVEYLFLFTILLVAPIMFFTDVSHAAAAAVSVAVNVFMLDLLHYYYHLEDDSLLSRFLDRISYFKRLKLNHTVHHNRSHMKQYNYNITYPWCDALFGTGYKKDKVDNNYIKNDLSS